MGGKTALKLKLTNFTKFPGEATSFMVGGGRGTRFLIGIQVLYLSSLKVCIYATGTKISKSKE